MSDRQNGPYRGSDREAPRRPGEDHYQYAARMGRQAAERGGGWRDNPHTPGTREWFEFDDGLKGR